ncbi:MAG: GntR family transcriptional regulator, partial [Chitinophagaceae bacterium]
YPAGLKDNTHFNSYGARRMAELVLADLRTMLPDLATRIVNSPVKK